MKILCRCYACNMQNLKAMPPNRESAVAHMLVTTVIYKFLGARAYSYIRGPMRRQEGYLHINPATHVAAANFNKILIDALRLVDEHGYELPPKNKVKQEGRKHHPNRKVTESMKSLPLAVSISPNPAGTD